MIFNFIINNDKEILSSKCSIYKTEQFIKQTSGFSEIDSFISKIAGGIIKNYIAKNNYFLNVKKSSEAFMISTLDREHTLFIKFGYQLDNKDLEPSDIIFYKYIGKDKKGLRLDRRFINYLKGKTSIDIVFKNISSDSNHSEFLKLYQLTNSNQINFPLLNSNQKDIVFTEDKNILVQGVAGSGKTNICIDKIIYAACRRYAGKVLYSTYSHSLLEDTKKKVDLFSHNIKKLINLLNDGKIEFLDDNHQKAIENKLGIWLDVDEDKKIIEKLLSITNYLDNKVDYFMLEDMYLNAGFNCNGFADESFFIKEYTNNIKNYNLRGNLEKIKHISYELIYKEIYGIIFGCVDKDNITQIMPYEEYKNLRLDNFKIQEIDTIYNIAQDYKKYLDKIGYVDNNIISRILINSNLNNNYSLCVLDEVQDFTQINLCFLINLASKIFCVGDVLQMINPTYFNFAYLKRLMFKEDIVNVIELKNNYRNSEKIERVIDNLSALNIEQFGTHNFVLRGNSIKSDVQTSTIYVNDGNFINQISHYTYSNLTIVVSSNKKKELIRKLLPKQEILTISEIKGLERESIILLDVLSDNYEKWQELNRNIINKKKAEENSIYRYYFNLLYVGISRAKQHLFVNERKNIELFEDFFNNNFEVLNLKNAITNLNNTIAKVEIDEEELLNRINEFIKLEQYDNAKWTASRLPDIQEINLQTQRIEIFEQYMKNRKYRDGGVRFWQIGLFDDAKAAFTLSKDEKLIELIDACIENNGRKLEYDIVQFYPDILDNDIATKLILETLELDKNNLIETQKQIRSSIKTKKEKLYGKQ